MPTYLGTTIPFFYGFTAFTPEVPKLYWDVKSQEQRIFEIVKTQHKLICYVDAVAEQLNGLSTDIEQLLKDFTTDVKQQLASQDEKITAQLAAQDAKVDKALQDMQDYIEKRFDEIATGMRIYDVTTGTYRPGTESMRRLFQALSYSHTGERQLVSWCADNKTVGQLAAQTVYNVAYSDRPTITIDDQIMN